MAHALHVDADRQRELGQAAFARLRVEHLVGLLLVAADDEARARMTQDILQFRPGIGRIDAEAGPAEHLRGEIGVEPFRRVVARHREPVAGAETERMEPDRETARLRMIVPPAHAAPDAERLLAQSEAVAMQLGAALQRLRDRHAGQRGGLAGHAARLVPR